MLNDLEKKYGDLKDSVSLYESMQNGSSEKDHREHIVFRFFGLIIDLLFYIIRRQH